ncbi:MAG: hypothetical protein LBU16_01800 [Treponema sp.]|jgi:hypothetical protein|nr:hypothetical protein [Treponema sp.]
MGTYRPLRLVFLGYDFIRLVVMTSLLVTFVQSASSHDGGVFPYVFYAVPNGLFPLMSFFLCVNLGAYRPFIALYMAGKTLAVVSVFAWLVFSLPRISASFFEGGRLTFVVVGIALLLSVGDAFSVLGAAALAKRSQNRAPPQERPLGQGPENFGAAEVPEEGN